jgi:methylenetetrahydrofolate dehydrogenase (NADP+) / methenyltetrahydrofolate cyclohydrolase
MALILSGRDAAVSFKNKIKAKVQKRIDDGKNAPHLAAILVGDNPASSAYVRGKVRDCKEVGFKSTLIHLKDDVREEELIQNIQLLNSNTEIDGYIVQLPLPDGINEKEILLSIDPMKDVDGFHPENLGRMALGLETFIPATPYGILLLLEYYGIETTGKNAVVVGRSHIVGSPMSILLSSNIEFGNATVTLAHSRTKNLKELTKNADILIAAVGKHSFIDKNFIKDGAVVIDVGINRVSGKLHGDVDFDSVKNIVSAISPVPGGVGLMTRVGLLMNTLQASDGRD